MPYQMQVAGMTEISELLTEMEEKAPAVAARGLYEGAGVMADAIGASAGNIRTAPFRFVREGNSRLPSPEEKEIVVQASAGIAKFDKHGTEVNTSVGFRNAAYATLKNKVVPIPKIVNAINSGTSFMQKQPFVRKAAAQAAPRAMEAIRAAIEADFEAMKNK